VVPSMGNNDGKYHYQGIDRADKTDYYGFFFEKWFKNHPLISKEAQLQQIETTFKYGGYYRVDVDSKLSILAVNTMYLNKKNDPTTQGTEAQDIIAWMRSQLSLAKQEGRKYILTNHIYPGAKYDSKSKDLLNSTYND
jgi:hypothetical protein